MDQMCVGHLLQDPQSTTLAVTLVNGTALCAKCVTDPMVMHPTGRLRLAAGGLRPQRRQPE